MENNKKKIFIEALEQRIMLDGAGASTALDIIDERNKEKLLNKNIKNISKFSENRIEDNSQKLPFDQVVRDQKRNDRKQVVFIDSQVQDYQKLMPLIKIRKFILFNLVRMVLKRLIKFLKMIKNFLITHNWSW